MPESRVGLKTTSRKQNVGFMRNTTYVFCFICLFFFIFFAREFVFKQFVTGPSITEQSALFLLAIGGVVALVFFYTRRSPFFLFTGSGLLAFSFLGIVSLLLRAPIENTAWFFFNLASYLLLFLGLLLALYHVIDEIEESRMEAEGLHEKARQ